MQTGNPQNWTGKGRGRQTGTFSPVPKAPPPAFSPRSSLIPQGSLTLSQTPILTRGSEPRSHGSSRTRLRPAPSDEVSTPPGSWPHPIFSPGASGSTHRLRPRLCPLLAPPRAPPAPPTCFHQVLGAGEALVDCGADAAQDEHIAQVGVADERAPQQPALLVLALHQARHQVHKAVGPRQVLVLVPPAGHDQRHVEAWAGEAGGRGARAQAAARAKRGRCLGFSIFLMAAGPAPTLLEGAQEGKTIRAPHEGARAGVLSPRGPLPIPRICQTPPLLLGGSRDQLALPSEAGVLSANLRTSFLTSNFSASGCSFPISLNCREGLTHHWPSPASSW